MEVIHQLCAGMDISKRDAKVCVRTPAARAGTYRKRISVHGAMSRDIAELGDYLVTEQVSLVVMEATGDYWKPFYRGLEGRVSLMVVNARHAKNLPGRKTDVSDAQWLTELAAHGLVLGSFIPPEPVRRLRDLTRSRTLLISERSREIQRLEKLLESTGIKYTSVTTRVLGVSGRAFLEALVAGEADPLGLARLARGRLKSKTAQLRLALEDSFAAHHAQLVRLALNRIDTLDAHIATISALVDELIREADLAWARDLLVTMPGLSVTGAENILAGIGADMSAFATASQLASWAGVCPGHYESAGRSSSRRTRPGNAHLIAALGIAAMAAIRTNGSFFQARYRRLTARRGKLRALVAIEHSMLTAIWHMLTHRQPYRDHHSRAT